MSLTGRLGTSDSLWGNETLGIDLTDNPLEQSVESVLAFTSDATAVDEPVLVSSAISFSQSATYQRDAFGVASSTLAFTDTAVYTTIPINSILAFTSTATETVNYARSVSSALDFQQDIISNIKSEEVVTPLNFVQVVGVAHDFTVAASSIMVLSSVAGRPRPASATTTMSLTSTAERKNIAISTLALTQAVTVGKGDEVSHVIAFDSQATYTAVLKRSVNSAISFSQSAIGVVESRCTPKNYTPFVGTGGDPSYTAPSTTPPVLGHATLTLTYPYATSDIVLVLRNPEPDNSDVLSFNRIKRESRGGSLIIFADPKWPKSQTLHLTVNNLTGQQVSDMKNFMMASLGREIGLLDWENRQWRGVIKTPDAQITQQGRHNRSITFEFQGEVV